MQLPTVIVSAALAFATGTMAWTQAGDGSWVANNTPHNIGHFMVHEACTTMNTIEFRTTGWCAYFADDKSITEGNCILTPQGPDGGAIGDRIDCK